MRRSQADVWVIAVVAAIGYGVAVRGAPTPVMTVVGIALLAAPGYLLAALLLASRITGLERVVVATGLALAVPVLGGLVLAAAKLPLHRAAWLGLLVAVTVVCDVALFFRRWAGRAAPFSWPTGWRLAPWHTAAFCAAVLIAAGGLGLARLGAKIQPEPGFTQLWLSPRTEKAPTASLGVTNDEGHTTSYRLVLLHNNHQNATWNLTLADGQTWQRAVPFSSTYTIAAELYRLPDLGHRYRYVVVGASGP
jgi:uncharacterized membrane protein